MPKSIKLGEHDIEIKSEEELVEQNAIILAMPVALMPTTPVPSVVVQCVTCEQDVWLSERASKPMYDKGLKAMCMTCVGKMKPGHD